MSKKIKISLLLFITLQSNSYSNINLSEWELMKKHLLLVKKYTHLQIEKHSAQYKFSKKDIDKMENVGIPLQHLIE